MTIHLQGVNRLRMCGAFPPRPLHALMARQCRVSLFTFISFYGAPCERFPAHWFPSIMTTTLLYWPQWHSTLNYVCDICSYQGRTTSNADINNHSFNIRFSNHTELKRCIMYHEIVQKLGAGHIIRGKMSLFPPKYIYINYNFNTLYLSWLIMCN